MTELNDDTFGSAFIDIDEWRDAPRPHRYVHGGFERSHTRFSFYLPPDDLYQGRLFQFLSGGSGGDENSLTALGIGFDWAFDTCFEELGGLIVESNQGHFADEGNTGMSGDLEMFGASAHTAQYAKEFAAQVFGGPPHHSYIWGGSGGGVRSLACIEKRPDVWDGDVSFVIGEASGSSLSLTLAYWWLHCRDRRDEIVDACEPGGTGDPFVNLTDQERWALATLYRGGWNRGAETQMWASASWMFGIAGLHDNDPTYFEDFWSVPGYLGHDDPDRLASVLVEQRHTVTEVVSGPGGPGHMWLPAVFGLGAPDSDRGSSWAIKVDGDLGDDANRLYMAQATVVSGQAKGRKVYIALQDGRLVGERMTSPDMFDGVEAGDEVQIDNRNLICWAHRWMYSIDLDRWTIEDPTSGERVLAPEFAGLGFLLADGRPIYPQRQGRVLPISQYGRLERKVIHVACTHDTIVPLPSVGHYHRMVREHHGANTDDIYRLWWHENGAHGAAEILLAMTTPDTNPALWHSRMVPYDGAIQHALVSIVRWVEDDIAPAPTTSYRFTDDSGLVLPETAADRGGVQAVVQALANGARRADVKVGEPVTLRGTAEQPALGVFAWAKWDPEGTGDFVEEAIDASTADLTVEITHSYEQPGTYFPSFRVGAHPDSSNARGLPIENSARTRVVVSER